MNANRMIKEIEERLQLFQIDNSIRNELMPLFKAAALIGANVAIEQTSEAMIELNEVVLRNCQRRIWKLNNRRMKNVAPTPTSGT